MGKNTGSQALRDILTQSEARLWVEFQESGVFKHKGLSGSGREQALITFLNGHLPGRFRAVSGEVVDVGGKRSGQIDVLIYDAVNSAPLLTQLNGNVLLAAESLLATIEVKTTLTGDQVEHAAGGILKVHSMRPYGQNWARYRLRDEAADLGPRVFSTVLAFKTDLGEADWGKKELARIRNKCASVGLHLEYLDRVAVLSRGLLLPAEGRLVSQQKEHQILGTWYSALINFLSREYPRRGPMPWSDYESWEGRTWTQVLEPAFTAPTPAPFSSTQIGKYKAGRQP